MKKRQGQTRGLGNFETELNAAMAVDKELLAQGRPEKMNCVQFPQDFPLVCF